MVDSSFPDGINFLHQDEALFKNMNSGFLDKHPDVPQQINLKEGDVELYKQRLQQFREDKKDALVCKYIFQSLADGDYKAYILGLQYWENVKKDSPIKSYRKKAIDSCKVVTLMLAHHINKAIVSGSSNEEIKNLLEVAVFILQNRFQVKQGGVLDNHVKQIRINLNSTYGYAKEKLGEFAEQFYNFIKVIESDDYAHDLSEGWEPAMSENFVAELAVIENEDLEEWTEIWQEESLSKSFKVIFNKFKEDNKPWIGIHRNIFKQKSNPYSGDRFNQIEKQSFEVDIKELLKK